MGCSSDERWEENVIPKILDENPRVQLAAIEAAGELGLIPAREILLKMLEEDENDALVVNVESGRSHKSAAKMRVSILKV